MPRGVPVHPRMKDQRRQEECEACRQLLHGSADEGCAFDVCLRCRIDPTAHAPSPICSSTKAITILGSRCSGRTLCARRETHSAQPDQHPENRRPVERLAFGHQRFDSDHPERRRGAEQRGESTRDRQFRPGKRASADAEREHAEQRGLPQLATARKMDAHDARDDQHHAAGGCVADAHQRDGRKRLQRQADAKVCGAPENAYAEQGNVCLKLWMISQGLGTMVAKRNGPIHDPHAND